MILFVRRGKSKKDNNSDRDCLVIWNKSSIFFHYKTLEENLYWIVQKVFNEFRILTRTHDIHGPYLYKLYSKLQYLNIYGINGNRFKALKSVSESIHNVYNFYGYFPLWCLTHMVVYSSKKLLSCRKTIWRTLCYYYL